MLPVRRVRTQQPRGFVRHDPAHPAQPLVLLSFQQGITLPNAVASQSPAAWTEAGTNALIFSASGGGLANGSGGLKYGSDIQFGRPSGTQPAWFAVRFRHGAYINNGSSTNVVAGYCSAAFNNGLAVEIDSSNALRYRVPGAAAATASTLTVGHDYTAVVAKATTGQWEIWLDGSRAASGTGATSLFPPDAAIYALRDAGTARYFSGAVYALAYGQSDIMALAASLSANIWQLFEPRRVWVPVGAAGSVTDADQDEALAAAAAQAAQLAAAAAASEAAAAAETAAATTVVTAAMAEAASAAEATASTATSARAIAEPASAAEAAAATVAAAAAVTGAASASEVLLASVLASAAQAEAVAAVESITTGAVLADSVSEPTSASDAASAASIALGALSEAAALAETAAAALIATSAASESLALADLYAAAVIALAAVTEAAAASEQVSSEPVTLADLAESATLTDTLAVAAALVAQVAEAGSVADQAQAAAELAALLTEPAVAADLIAAAVPVTHDESVAELITALDAIAAALASEVIISVVWRYNVPAAAGAWRMDVAAADGGWRYDVPAASIGIAVP